MATGNSVGDEIREQHGKMKGKTKKEKFAYFWEYYKVHTIVIILVIIAVSNFIYSIATQKDSAMEAAFVNTYLGSDIDSLQMAADFEAYAGVDTKDYEVRIDENMFVDYESMDQYAVANVQKIMAMAAGQSLDVIVTDDSYLEQNCGAGLFADLTEVLPADVLTQYADQLYYLDIPDDDKGEVPVPVAIDIRNSKYLLSDQLPSLFTIVGNAPNLENAQKFLEFMMEP